MANSDIKVSVEIENYNELTEKISRLNLLLQESIKLIGEIQETSIKLKV